MIRVIRVIRVIRDRSREQGARDPLALREAPGLHMGPFMRGPLGVHEGP